MESVDGVVSEASNSSSVNGSAEGTVYTTHAALFRLGGRRVRVTSMAPLAITDGDRMLVAGVQGSDAFHALAHVNLSRGVRGDQGWARPTLLGTLLVVCGAGGLVAGADAFAHGGLAAAQGGLTAAHGGVTALAGVGMTAGALVLRHAARVFKAVRHVRRQAAFD